jgi:anti-sigma28 factor (negative regulator of flagellin synthesis)
MWKKKEVQFLSAHISVKRGLQASLMRAHKLKHKDLDLTFPSEKMAHSVSQVQHEKPKFLKDQLAQRDIEVVMHGLEHLKIRNERIEALKVQVNAGTYQMDSTSIAQRMVGSSLARKILDTGCYNMPVFKDEE